MAIEFLILQYLTTRVKKYYEQFIVFCLGCFLLGLLWYDLMKVTTINFLILN